MDLELALEVLRRERLPRIEGDELSPRLCAARLAALGRLTRQPYAEVLAHLLVLLRELPSSARLNLDVGCLADLSGDFTLARAYLSRAVELAPGSGVAAALYAEHLARAEGDEAAAAFVARALPRDPEEPLLLLMRARLLHRREGGAAALEAYRAVEERGGARRSIIFYAHAAREAGERALARTLTEVACERHGGDDGLWHLCGELRLSAGEEEGARRALERALALNASHLHARYTLGLLLRARRPRAAARHLRRAAAHLPEARLDLARLLARRGRARAAREELLTLAGLQETPAEVRAEARDLLRALGPPPPPPLVGAPARGHGLSAPTRRARLRPLGEGAPYEDELVEEAPLALWVNERELAVLMCTPTDALDLAAGFLWTQGLIEEREDLARLELCARDPGRARVTLAPGVPLPAPRHRAPLSSSCGLCSLSEGEGLLRSPRGRVWGAAELSAEEVRARLAALDEATPLFRQTGGSHGALLCDPSGSPRFAREDVGRHNAVDKVLGAALRAGEGRVLSGEGAAWGLAGWSLVVTSRAGFEVARKAAMAGVSALVSVGAATALTHRFCEEVGLSLVSFARPGRAHRH